MGLYGFSTKLEPGDRVFHAPENSVGTIRSITIILSMDEPDKFSVCVLLQNGRMIDCSENDLEKLAN